MTPLALALLIGLVPQARSDAPPSVTRSRPPIPTFTPTPTPTPVPTAAPPPATAVPTPRLSAVARARTLNSAVLPAPRLVFPQLAHTRTAGVVSVNGWLTNVGGLPACAITMRVVVLGVLGETQRHVGSAEGAPGSPDLAPGHGSPFAFSVSIPKALDDDPKFQIGSVNASIVSYSGECRD